MPLAANASSARRGSPTARQIEPSVNIISAKALPFSSAGAGGFSVPGASAASGVDSEATLTSPSDSVGGGTGASSGATAGSGVTGASSGATGASGAAGSSAAAAATGAG